MTNDLSHALTGDAQAFRLVFDCYYAKVRGFAFKFCGLDWMADEIAQNVFYKLWVHRHELKITSINVSVESLKGYIFTMTRNEVMDYFRTRRQIADYQEKFAQEICTEFNVAGHLDAKECLRLVNEVVKMMPRKRREVFVLSRFRHIPNEEIAGMLGISKRTVEQHITRSLAQLRMELSAYIV